MIEVMMMTMKIRTIMTMTVRDLSKSDQGNFFGNWHPPISMTCTFVFCFIHLTDDDCLGWNQDGNEDKEQSCNTSPDIAITYLKIASGNISADNAISGERERNWSSLALLPISSFFTSAQASTRPQCSRFAHIVI